MSTRPQIGPETVISKGDITTTLTSLPTIIQKASLISYTYSWSGASPSAAITVQVSNDYSLNAAGQIANAGTWNTLPLSTSPVISGNTGNGAIDIQNISAYAIRTQITPISGTGTVTATVTGKVS